jgi:hypothetical protein
MLCMLTTKVRCLQEIPPSDPVDQGDEGDWETVESRLREAAAQPRHDRSRAAGTSC